jgi:site-specific DNA recombinase
VKRCANYARVSYYDRRGENLDDQMRMCREYADEHGYVVIAELGEDDRGASGADFDLPKLNEALELAREGLIDVFVTREMDRFARDLAKQLITEREFNLAGVDIEYVLGDYPDTPEGAMQKNVKAVFADYERLKTIERTRRARRRRVRAGNVSVSGLPLLGFRETVSEYNERRLEVNEDEAWIIRLIFEWYTVGADGHPPLSIYEIARRLSDMQIPTFTEIRKRPIRKKKRGYGQWSRSVIHKILSNPAYAGRWQYGKRRRVDGRLVKNPPENIIEVEVPAIVDEATWDGARRRLEINRERRRGRRPTHQYLLSKRVRCGNCGYAMGGHVLTPRNMDRIYQYYKCPSNSATNTGCKMPMFRADEVDREVWEYISELVRDREGHMRRIEQSREKQSERQAAFAEELVDIENRLKESAAEMERLTALYLTGEYDLGSLNKQNRRIKAAEAGLTRRREVLLSRLQEAQPEDVEAYLDYFDQMSEMVELAENSFEKRRWFVEMLDVTAKLSMESDEKSIEVECTVAPGARLC